MTTVVDPAALAAKLAPQVICSCTAKSVGPCHQRQYPNGPVTCAANCGEPLDPLLWKDGLHVGCTRPAPIPTQLTTTSQPGPCLDPYCANGAAPCGYTPNQHLEAHGVAAIIANDRSTGRIPAATFAAPAGPKVHPIKAELIEIIRWASSNAPRSLQRAIGPSEIGVDCMRRIAYRYTGARPVNTASDPWFSIVGTAVHDWLDTAINLWCGHVLGTQPGGRWTQEPRYLTEKRVTATADQHGVSGSCDLYDQERATVIDHKVVGATALKKYIDQGPSNQYRIQVHTYGKGYQQAGHPVREVAIAFYPRSGYLTDMHVWSEPFDESIADQALTRAATVRQLATVLPIGQIPAHPDQAACTWCPFFRGGMGPADQTGCPGPQS